MDGLSTVLIVGGGGREHALLKAILRTERAVSAFAYPGNPGMEDDGCTLVRDKVNGWSGLAVWAESNGIELTVVGPEAPLVEGIVDTFARRRLCVFGPSAAAARIEGSKAFAKKLMKKHRIPTAAFETFTTKKAAVAYVKKHGAPLVVKASGLAAGKGALVCNTEKDALEALERMFDAREFGAAGDTVVVEEKMTGDEVSVFVLTDGIRYRMLPVAQDHKPVGDGDKGPNTGGMGAYAPASGLVDRGMLKRIEEDIVKRTLEAMRAEGAPYRGLLYCGLMITSEGPKVVEYNCRFGDPETQAILPLVRCDWFETFRACALGSCSTGEWDVVPGACASVVLASKGYPGAYEKGKVIHGIEDAENIGNVDVYHAGTTRNDKGEILSNGGRVLAVSAWDGTLAKAVERAYRAVDKISFEGKYYRRDIGAKGLVREGGTCR